MIRRLFIVAAATLLLLDVGVAVLWVRSERAAWNERSSFSFAGRFWRVSSTHGNLIVETSPDPRPSPRPKAAVLWWTWKRPVEGLVDWHGFSDVSCTADLYLFDPHSGAFIAAAPVRLNRFGAPCWPIALILATPSMIVLRWWYSGRRRVEPRRCSVCGCDLRGIKERCPECGAPIPAESKA